MPDQEVINRVEERKIKRRKTKQLAKRIVIKRCRTSILEKDPMMIVNKLRKKQIEAKIIKEKRRNTRAHIPSH